MFVVVPSTSLESTKNFISAAPTLVPWNVTIPPVGVLVITGAVALRPLGEVITRFVVVGPAIAPVAAKVAVWVRVGWVLPANDQVIAAVTRLKSSGWGSLVDVLALSEHQETLVLCEP